MICSAGHRSWVPTPTSWGWAPCSWALHPLLCPPDRWGIRSLRAETHRPSQLDSTAGALYWLYRRWGSREWGQGPRHMPRAPETWPSAQCHLGGRVGASLGTSKHHSWKREAGLETSLGTAFALGIPVHPSLQGGKDLGLGGREPKARAHLPGQSLLQAPAVFKDRAPHTSRLRSVPGLVPPSRPQGPTDGPRAPPGGQSQPDGAAAEGGVTALNVRHPVSSVREQAAPLCSPRPGRDGGSPPTAGFPEVSVQMGGAAMITPSE